MSQKKLEIIIKRGVGVWGPGPDGPASTHYESPEGEAHTVDAAFGWQLVGENRATLARADESTPGMAEFVEPRVVPGQRPKRP